MGFFLKPQSRIILFLKNRMILKVDEGTSGQTPSRWLGGLTDAQHTTVDRRRWAAFSVSQCFSASVCLSGVCLNESVICYRQSQVSGTKQTCFRLKTRQCRKLTFIQGLRGVTLVSGLSHQYKLTVVVKPLDLSSPVSPVSWTALATSSLVWQLPTKHSAVKSFQPLGQWSCSCSCLSHFDICCFWVTSLELWKLHCGSPFYRPDDHFFNWGSEVHSCL